jgi:hypothetical protein
MPAAAILEAHPGCAEVVPFSGGAARRGAGRGWQRPLGFGALESPSDGATWGEDPIIRRRFVVDFIARACQLRASNVFVETRI